MYNMEVLLVGLRNVKDDCGDKGLPGRSCPVMHYMLELELGFYYRYCTVLFLVVGLYVPLRSGA